MRKKLLRFQENALAANVIEPGKEMYERMRGRWHHYFRNEAPIALELGCGKGTYTVALAEQYPRRNFVGIDIKGARFWSGSQKALHSGLLNVAFLRADIASLRSFFTREEIDEIFLPFPDPRPRDKEEKKRLTSPRFLKMYEELLPVGGRLHFKTDSMPFFEYTSRTLAASAFSIQESTDDIDQALPEENLHRRIQTPYEKRFVAEGRKTKYIKCILR